MRCCYNISALYVYPSVAGEANTRVTIFPPAVFCHIGKFNFVTMVMDTPPSHLFIAPIRACVQLSQNAPAIVTPLVHHLLIKFLSGTQKFVFLLSITVEILFCIRDLELAFRRVKFFLQVFTTDFNSFRRGKYKVIRSLVSEESYENYFFRCSGQLASLPFFLLLTRIDKDCQRRCQNTLFK